MAIFQGGCLLLFLLWGSGCATSFRSVKYAEHVVAYNVDGHVVEKMEARLPLELVEIIHLAEKDVPDSLVIGYIKQEQTIYQLNSDHVTMLAEHGVSKMVIDYLMTTPAAHAIRPQPMRYHLPPPPFPYYHGIGHHYGAGFFCC
jgi:hypothetical protein